MKRFCLNAAFNTSPRRVLNMLVDEALSFEAYYEHEAVQYRIGELDQFGQYEASDPVEHEFLCQKSEEARNLAAELRESPAFPVVLSAAAGRLAGHCMEVGDFEMADEMAALADRFAAQQAARVRAETERPMLVNAFPRPRAAYGA